MKAHAWPRGLFLMGVIILHYPASALDWKTIPGGRYAELPAPGHGRTGFTLLPPEATGVFFTNVVAQERHLTNQIYLNGSGVALGDVDGDGWCDIYFCGLDSPNKLYRNLGGWKFQDITEAAGVACPSLDATGAAFADLDGDGDLDLVVNSVGGGTHCFFNDGQGHFHESPTTGVLNPGRGGTSPALADMDGDGYLDLYVANYRTVTLRDQPNTRFTFKLIDGQPVVTAINGRPPTGADLTNRFNFKVVRGERGLSLAQEENGEPDALYRNLGGGRFALVPFTGGAFSDEQGRPLAEPPFDWGLSVIFRDLNEDGAPDIYVCNDFKSPDRCWLNDGRGRFRAIAPLALRHICLSAMGLDVADINRDGHDDIFVLDMLSPVHERRFNQRIDIKPEALSAGQIDNRPQYPRNMLFVGRGDGTYAEVAQFSGLEATEWSWTPVFLDVDLDGYEDLLVATGFERDNMNVDALRQLEQMKREKSLSSLEQLRLRRNFPRLVLPNLAFRNLGNLRFANVSAEWGFNTPVISQGTALADLDNDGDLDVVVNNFNSVAGLYRNETAAPRLAVRLKGNPPNTHGIGGKIEITGGPVRQSQQIVCGGRYCSCDDAVRVFAAGALTNELTIEVLWRSGTRSVVTGVKPNRIYEIAESEVQGPKSKVQSPKLKGSVVSGPLSVANTTDNGQRTTDHGPLTTDSNPQSAIAPHFQDVSLLLNHSHHEAPFDDFALQPLLPNRLSQLGPGVAWFDVDGDGWDGLLIGSGRGGTLAYYRNDGHGGFQRVDAAPFTDPVMGNQTTILGWRAGGQAVLLSGSANFEAGQTNGTLARRYDPAGHTVGDLLPGELSSTGPLAMADIDGDGELDLFVGGRVIAGRYPEPASSLMFRNHGGQFAPDEENSRRLAKLGLVSGAVFSDLDGDGDPDLILACEWGPVRIFRNDHGTFTEVTDELGMGQYRGWWNGVTTGDFDGDGRLDIVASNWGQNTKYERYRRAPLRLFYGDLDGNGTVEVIEAFFDPSLNKLLPLQPFHQVAAALPLVRERVGTCTAYAQAGLEEIYGDLLKGAKELQANWLESTVFLNRGNRFEARALPLEAQLAPAFAVCVGDFDGDGREDIFLSQNFFATQPETSRCDAGRGLWLKGDGRGGFQAVPGQESGILVYGEQRGAALCDYDGDGRVDLVVTQNGAETKLYHNLGARPGLRVRLKGPPGNPQGIGAVLRLGTADQPGPARELHAGSGYWSQDSAVAVLAAPGAPARLWVRWPGGKETSVPVPPGAKEMVVEWR